MSAMERMKRSQEKHTAQQQIQTIQRRVIEVTQRLQPIQYKAYQFFTEVEGRGAKLEQVVTEVKQRLEGLVNDVVIQEFIEEEAMEQKQVEVARANLEVFEEELPKSE
jgi:hypothetical protein